MKDQSVKSYLLDTVKGALFFALLIPALNVSAQSQSDQRINIGLIYPISSNGARAKEIVNKFSLNAIAGLSAGETGFTLAGVSNIVKNNTKGVQIAGFSNHIGRKADGCMLAGFINTYHSGNGFAIAGFGNFAKDSSNAQIAGFINSGGNVSSIQVGGFANIARNVKGTQIAGFINKAKNVKGIQISGFLNVADTANYQLGFINLSKNGEKSLGVSIDDDQTILLSLRSGGKVLYGIIGAGYNLQDHDDKYALQAGLGMHVISISTFRLNAELSETTLLNLKGSSSFKSSFALLPAIRLSNRFDIFAGPSLCYIESDNKDAHLADKKFISTWRGNNGSDFRGLYIGYTAGIAVKF